MSGGCYSELWRKQIEPDTFPAQLKANGYQTFYAGKYLNQYRSSEIPPGYDDWYGLHGNSRYYNYTLNENGILRRYGNGERDYLTDVLVNCSLACKKNERKWSNVTKIFVKILGVPSKPLKITQNHGIF